MLTQLVWTTGQPFRFRRAGSSERYARPHVLCRETQSSCTSHVSGETYERVFSLTRFRPSPPHHPRNAMENVRKVNVPTVPFAASAMEGVVRKRATLSDTENLAVGAFGGVLETCIQSTLEFRFGVVL